MRRRRVVIVGGGITGLTVAYRLLTAARDADGAPLTVTLLEQRPRLGGVIQTERRDGFLIDGGPDSFAASLPEASALCRELGLGDRLITTTARNRRAYLLHRGALEPLPEGLFLGVPTRALPVISSRLLRWPAKARAAMDLLLPRGPGGRDESIHELLRRRLGSAASASLAEPLLGGLSAGNVDTLSVQATFPELVDLEKNHRSLIVGAAVERAARDGDREGREPSLVLSLLGGMGELTDTLAGRIEKAGGEIRIDARVTAIARGDERARFLVRTTRATGGAPEELEADDVVLCTPAYAAADALDGIDREITAKLRQILYASTASIICGYHRVDVPHPLDASEVFVPQDARLRDAPSRSLWATFISSKWTGRAPSDAALLRVVVGGHRDTGVLALSDDELIALARGEIGALLGVRARPTLARVYRYGRTNVQPVRGHAARVQKIRALAERHPGLHFAGAAFDGISIPACVRQAAVIAARIVGAR